MVALVAGLVPQIERAMGLEGAAGRDHARRIELRAASVETSRREDHPVVRLAVDRLCLGRPPNPAVGYAGALELGTIRGIIGCDSLRRSALGGNDEDLGVQIVLTRLPEGNPIERDQPVVDRERGIVFV